MQTLGYLHFLKQKYFVSYFAVRRFKNPKIMYYINLPIIAFVLRIYSTRKLCLVVKISASWGLVFRNCRLHVSCHVSLTCLISGPHADTGVDLVIILHDWLTRASGEVMRKHVEHVQPQCENDRNAVSMTGAQRARDDSFSQAALSHVGGAFQTLRAYWQRPPVIDVRQPLPSSTLVIGTLTNPGHCLGVCAR